MVFSKSFGYAVRSMIYLSSEQGNRPYVQAWEISRELGIPRHFLSKVLKALAREGILNSSKGPLGGFALTAKSLQTPLLALVSPTKALPHLYSCALSARNCDGSKPCPMHVHSSAIRKEIIRVLSEINISQLIRNSNSNYDDSFPFLPGNNQPSEANQTNLISLP